jgi:eukaryotic-like serine/threonine-protein kinase
MRKVLIAVFWLLLVGTAAGQGGESWNIFRGDPALRGYSGAELRFPMALKWTFQADDAIVAAPVIGNKTIFVSSTGGIVYALDFSGKLKWSFETDNSIEAPALYLDGKVYIGNLSGSLYALDGDTGKEIWRYQADNQIMGSANYYTLRNRLHLLVGSYDYFLHCVDAETGRLVWKYESDNYINGAPAVDRQMALFGGCDGFLHLVNLLNGQGATKIEVATYIAGSVASATNLVYTGDYDGLFSCIDVVKKEVRWRFDNPESNLPILGSPAIAAGKVVIGGQDKYVRCFDNQGRQIWSFRAGGRLDASPVIVKNTVIAATMDGWVYALNLSDGKQLWSYEIGSAIAHNPAVVNRCMAVAARDGFVYWFEN